MIVMSSRRDAQIFHKLVSVDEAVEILYKTFVEAGYPEVIEVSIEEALGKISAEDVYADVDYPPFDRSTVDGYAVRSIDVAGANDIEPKILRIVGEVDVGELPQIEIREGETVEISTGAVIPRGADAVVMSEYTKKVGDKVFIYRHAYPGENISQAGTDFSAGDLVIRRGALITYREIASLAAVGRARIKILKPLNIVVYSTGKELVKPGERLSPGKIYDINGYSIISILKDLGMNVVYKGILKDEYEKIREEINKSLEEYDVVITSGGTSAGYKDLVYRVIEDLGGKILFHGLKTRPGKPTLLASRDKKIFIGLPGFPLSAMMVLTRIVRPAILRVYGLDEKKNLVKILIPYRIEAGRGVREFVPVSIVESEKGFVGYPIQLGSGSVYSVLYSDGFIEVSEDREFIDEDEEVYAILFSEKIVPAQLYFIGSHCLGVELLLKISKLRNTKIIYTGSLGGWHAIKRGEADIAGTHLLDEDTGEYNIHMIKKMGLEDKVYLIRGYVRKIGFIVRKGNPKNIRSFEDLLREDVIFINRNRGSGIRSFTDIMIKRILGEKDPYKMIRGYSYEVKTHTAVAAAVSMGRADVGIAVETVTQFYDVDFIPLAEEVYDFVVSKKGFNKESVKRFVETLSSRDFKEILSKTLRGYRALENTGEIIFSPR